MAAAWWVFQRRFELRALAGLVVGAFVGAAPPLIMRWIDPGNPLLPAYNNIFHSPYWPPVNEQFNFPYLHHPGALGPLSALARSVTPTGALQEAAPIGSFGLLVGAVVIAMALGWGADARRPPSRARALDRGGCRFPRVVRAVRCTCATCFPRPRCR